MKWNGGNDFRTTKGNLLFQVGPEFKEIGIEKTWWLSNTVSLTGGYKGEWIQNTFQHVDLLEVRWWVDIPLFPDYFKKLTEEQAANSTPNTLRKRSPSFNSY
jgi:hypothetical protein